MMYMIILLLLQCLVDEFIKLKMDCQPIRKRPRIKNDRILRERIEKFISPLYFADVNLFSR